MIENPRHATPCANEACSRPAEPGEAYCGTCGLERSLYRRDSRQGGAQNATETRPERARR